jgi:L-fucose dehydrogenase
MDLNLNDKTVLVTGGASGIGEAIVRGLVSEKAFPVIIDKNEDAAERLRKEFEAENIPAKVILSDMSTADKCGDILKEISTNNRSVYALVNNAGINDGAGLINGTADDFLTSLQRNLHHCYFMAKACLEGIIKNRGAIINISSKTALTGQGNTSGYAASKGAMLGLAREWAVDLAPHGVRVNAIIPSEVLTPQYEEWLKNFPQPEQKRKKIEEKIPLGNRFTTPEEIADITLFLLSEKASHITGQFLHVDGGYIHLDRAITN